MHDISAGIIRIKKEDYSNIAIILFFVLVVCRGLSDIFFYLFAGIAVVVFLISRSSYCFLYLFFLLPFAPLLKQVPGQISFFTVLYLLTVVKMVRERKRYHAHVISLLILFAVYGIVFSGFSEIFTVLKMSAGLVMVYSIRESDSNVEKAILYFSFGVCGASVLALLKDVFPYVEIFVRDSMMRLGKDEFIVRFSGLHGNPNYYTMDITVILSALFVILNKHRGNGLVLALFGALSVFGMMSISKSFILSWILLMAVWFVISMRQGAKKIAGTLLLIILIVGGSYIFALDYVSAMLGRFLGDQGATLGDITTGRTELWMLYMEKFFGDMKVFLFGNGLNNHLYKGAHNTYIESVFYLGLTGTIIWLSTIKRCMGKVISSPIMWVPVGVLLVRMMAIGITTYDNLVFYLALIVMLSKYSAQMGDLIHETKRK